jgi:phosphoglycolate phosphatase
VGSFVGEGIEALVRKLFSGSGVTEEELPSLVEAFRRDYHEHCADKTRLYQGVEQTLKELQGAGYKMAVVTNKPERISMRILELLGVAGHFGCVIGGNSCPTKKPDPGPLLEACRRLGVPLQDACMIGDSRVDIEAGRNAGIPALGILGGIGDEALLRKAGPSLLLKDFSGLNEIFGRPS